MFRESNFENPTSLGVAADGVLRHPDGSINFDLYRARALRARRVAIASLMRRGLSALAVAFAGKGAPAARHHAT